MKAIIEISLISICIVLLLLGFTRAAMIHIGTVFLFIKTDSYFWLLEVGLFIIWLPLILLIRRPKSQDGYQNWPFWINFPILALIIYGIVNSLICQSMFTNNEFPKRIFEYWRLRGDSGAIMVMYGCALIASSFTLWRKIKIR